MVLSEVPFRTYLLGNNNASLNIPLNTVLIIMLM